jgi:hypothetical protein
MAIPDKPLVLNDFDPNELTLDEAILLSEPDKFKPSAYKDFLVKYTDWTPEEVGKMTLGELTDVTKQLAERINESSIPLAS